MKQKDELSNQRPYSSLDMADVPPRLLYCRLCIIDEQNPPKITFVPWMMVNFRWQQMQKMCLLCSYSLTSFQFPPLYMGVGFVLASSARYTALHSTTCWYWVLV